MKSRYGYRTGELRDLIGLTNLFDLADERLHLFAFGRDDALAHASTHWSRLTHSMMICGTQLILGAQTPGGSLSMHDNHTKHPRQFNTARCTQSPRSNASSLANIRKALAVGLMHKHCNCRLLHRPHYRLPLRLHLASSLQRNHYHAANQCPEYIGTLEGTRC